MVPGVIITCEKCSTKFKLDDARIPEDEVIVTCVALGYPEDDFAANDVKSSRRPGWRRMWGSRTEARGCCWGR